MTSPPSSSLYNLLQACGQIGCPVCRVGAQSTKRYLASLFYEYVNDPVARDRLVKSRGVCKEHARLLLETRLADAFGASIIYENIVKRLLRDYPDPDNSKISSGSPRPEQLVRITIGFVSSSDHLGPCPVCEERAKAADRALSELRDSLQKEEVRAALQRSDGLCFPHLAELVERIKNTENIRFLLVLTKRKLEKRQSEMAELIRKNDYQAASEQITQQEALAWKKTMCMLSGESFSLTGDEPDS